MTVQNNTSGMSSYYQMKLQKKKQEEEAEKLASGSQINSASDNPAGLAVSEKMRAQITIAKTAQANASSAQNLVNTAEGAMQEINSMINRATELATQSSNGIYTEVERGAMQSEIDAITSEISRVTQSTNFNGISLLDGSFSADVGSLDMQVGVDSSVSSTIGVNIENLSVASNFDAGSIQVLSQEDAIAVLDQLKEFVNTITAERSELGATDNRLTHTGNSLSIMEEYLQKAESQIRDTDVAKTATEESQARLTFNYATSSLQKSQEEQKSILNLFA